MGVLPWVYPTTYKPMSASKLMDSKADGTEGGLPGSRLAEVGDTVTAIRTKDRGHRSRPGPVPIAAPRIRRAECAPVSSRLSCHECGARPTAISGDCVLRATAIGG